MKIETSTNSGGPFRVMVVDDSAIIRGFLCRYLTEDPQIEVVTTANNGLVALRQLEQFDVEVVVLDIEMPEMNGMTALPKMMEMQPELTVVMASTLTRKNAEVSLRALQLGAVDYVPKPDTARSVNANIDFRRELVDKVKAWAGRRRKRQGLPLPLDAGAALGASATAATGFAKPTARTAAPGFVTVSRPTPPKAIASSSSRGDLTSADSGKSRSDSVVIKYLKGSKYKPRVLLVGSSTGGPQALLKFFKGFNKKAPTVPILITQHMPATFTAILADHLGQATGWPSFEAADGMKLEAGSIYVAPGGLHLEAREEKGQLFACTTDAPPENFCKPAVDPLFRSVTSVYGEKVLAVILTGMGHDGLKGARELTKAGGTLYAQDEASSVVWGMPGAVATAGLCTQILPIDQLGAAVVRRLEGGIQ